MAYIAKGSTGGVKPVLGGHNGQSRNSNAIDNLCQLKFTLMSSSFFPCDAAVIRVSTSDPVHLTLAAVARGTCRQALFW